MTQKRSPLSIRLFSVRRRPELLQTTLLQYNTPTFHQHGTSWVYQFPNRRQVIIRCPRDKDWTTRIEILQDSGVIYNATACSCSIASIEIRAMSELHGATDTRLDAPSLHLPDWSHVLAVQEIPQIEEVMPTGAMDINNIESHLPTHQKSFDLNTASYSSKRLSKSGNHTYMIITPTSCAISILFPSLSTFPPSPLSYALFPRKQPSHIETRTSSFPFPQSRTH